MTLRVRVESTYTRRLVDLERLCALARQQGLTDDAQVGYGDHSSVVVSEEQPESAP